MASSERPYASYSGPLLFQEVGMENPLAPSAVNRAWNLIQSYPWGETTLGKYLASKSSSGIPLSTRAQEWLQSDVALGTKTLDREYMEVSRDEKTSQLRHWTRFSESIFYEDLNKVGVTNDSRIRAVIKSGILVASAMLGAESRGQTFDWEDTNFGDLVDEMRDHLSWLDDPLSNRGTNRRELEYFVITSWYSMTRARERAAELV